MSIWFERMEEVRRHFMNGASIDVRRRMASMTTLVSSIRVCPAPHRPGLGPSTGTQRPTVTPVRHPRVNAVTA
jgi:hypothetical protein